MWGERKRCNDFRGPRYCLDMNPKRSMSVKSNSHRELIVWQRAVDLAVEVNQLSRKLPSDERFGLALQMRSAAVSIASNIAEGKGRYQRKDFARFLSIARGSSRELDTHFVIAQRSEYLRAHDIAAAESALDEVGRMLTALLRRLTPL
jgi:four helix bundle protein